ncbi:MAG: ornithine cyclodeaminase family protein [Nitrososphaerales archaeon]|nr:ornithine cyclodeaminase family protein [Nitrososphaerales archaeon]
MTLILSEKDVQDHIGMKDVVPAVEECFRQQAGVRAVNSPRTRSVAQGAVLNVMHASLPYLGRAGVKSYLSSRKGVRFLFILFSLDDGQPLAVMGADILGRYRTGAASAVATKFLFGSKRFRLAVFGSGKQALTQVLAMAEVASLEAVRVWSPTREHRESFARDLGRLGFRATSADAVEGAASSSDVATAITTSGGPFLTRKVVRDLAHVNLCGSNTSGRAEAAPDAVSWFKTVAVDDLAQSRVEAGDLILAEQSGLLTWDRVVELKDIVAGGVRQERPTLFKSNGVAIEDVAVASLIYDKAVKAGLGPDHKFEFGSV